MCQTSWRRRLEMVTEMIENELHKLNIYTPNFMSYKLFVFKKKLKNLSPVLLID